MEDATRTDGTYPESGSEAPPAGGGRHRGGHRDRHRGSDRGGAGSAALIGLSIILSMALLVGGILYYKTETNHSISATGSASVDFDSDLVVWRGSFSASARTSRQAYDQIKAEAAAVRRYLLENGMNESDIVFNAVDISQQYEYSYDNYGNLLSSRLSGYRLSQGVVVTSSDIDTVEKISRDISSLLEQGVEFVSGQPEYYYTRLDDVKLDLIRKATENSRQRIDIMADASGARVGKLESSSLGVFQITAQNSGTANYSYDGYFDTSSRSKTATITVYLQYAVK